MRIHAISAISAALIGLATVGFAQDIATDFQTTQEIQDAQNGVVARYEGWEIRCQGEPAECRLFSKGIDADGNEVVNLAMQALPEGAAAELGVTIVTPLLTLLPRGATVRVDDRAPAGYPFSWCDPLGCYARYGLTAEEVAQLRAGGAIKVTIMAVTNQQSPIEANISLAGFTAAVEDLQGR